MASKPLESVIQRKTIKRLEASGWLVVKLIQTTMNGITDLVALKNGEAVFIEIKRPGERPTRLQVYVHNRLRDAGFKVLIITNENQVDALL